MKGQFGQTKMIGQISLAAMAWTESCAVSVSADAVVAGST